MLSAVTFLFKPHTIIQHPNSYSWWPLSSSSFPQWSTIQRYWCHWHTRQHSHTQHILSLQQSGSDKPSQCVSPVTATPTPCLSWRHQSLSNQHTLHQMVAKALWAPVVLPHWAYHTHPGWLAVITVAPTQSLTSKTAVRSNLQLWTRWPITLHLSLMTQRVTVTDASPTREIRSSSHQQAFQPHKASLRMEQVESPMM